MALIYMASTEEPLLVVTVSCVPDYPKPIRDAHMHEATRRFYITGTVHSLRVCQHYCAAPLEASTSYGAIWGWAAGDFDLAIFEWSHCNRANSGFPVISTHVDHILVIGSRQYAVSHASI